MKYSDVLVGKSVAQPSDILAKRVGALLAVGGIHHAFDDWVLGSHLAHRLSRDKIQQIS